MNNRKRTTKNLTVNVSLKDGKGRLEVPYNLSKNLLDPYISILSIFSTSANSTFVQLVTPSSFYISKNYTPKNNILGHFWIKKNTVCYAPSPIKLYLNNCPETIDIWAEDERGLIHQHFDAQIVVEIKSYFKE